MQIDNYTSQGFQSKTFSAEFISSQNDFPLNPQSPVSTNQNLTFKNLHHDNLTDDHFLKSLNSENSSTKIRPDSTQL